MPSSVVSDGTLTSGFSRATSSFGLIGETEVETRSMRSLNPVSSDTTTTLRTNGEAAAKRNFIMVNFPSEHVLAVTNLGERRDRVADRARRSACSARQIGAQERVGQQFLGQRARHGR